MGENPLGNLLPRLQPIGDPPTDSFTRAVRTDALPKTFAPNGNGSKSGEQVNFSLPPSAPSGNSGRLEFEPNLFQGRFDERERMAEKIRELERHSIARPLVEIVGPLALGKSWLLKFFKRGYSITAANKTESAATFTTLVDFESLKEFQDSEFDWSHHLLRLLIAELNAEGFTHAFRHAQVNDANPQFPLDPYQRTETVKELTQWMEHLAQEQIPILLFDSLQVVPSSFFEWFEEELVEPLVHSRRVLVVVAGRYPRVWREPETSQRRDQWILNELEQIVWDAQPINREGEPIPQWVHTRYAYGYPGVALELYRKLATRGQENLQKIKNATRNSKEEQNLVRDSVRQTIDQVVLTGIETELRELIANVATQRMFNPDVLQEFTRKFGAPDTRTKTFPYFRHKVRELIDANVAKFSISLNDYMIHPPMRRAIAECVRVTEGPENFQARHKSAFDYYVARLQQAPSMAAEWCVPEILYHRGEMAELEKPDSAAPQVLEQLDELLKTKLRDVALDKLEIRMARATSREREDIDLVELHRDLIWRIGETKFEDLLHKLRSHNQRFDAN